MKKQRIYILLVPIIVILLGISISIIKSVKKFSSPRIKEVFIESKSIIELDTKKYIAIEGSFSLDSADGINLYGVNYQKNKIIIVNIASGIFETKKSNYPFVSPKILLIPVRAPLKMSFRDLQYSY